MKELKHFGMVAIVWNDGFVKKNFRKRVIIDVCEAGIVAADISISDFRENKNYCTYIWDNAEFVSEPVRNHNPELFGKKALMWWKPGATKEKNIIFEITKHGCIGFRPGHAERFLSGQPYELNFWNYYEIIEGNQI